MKSKSISFTLLLLLTVVFLQSCFKDECTNLVEYKTFEPVYKSIDAIRTDIVAASPRELCHPGKIYYYQNYLLINEQQEGIHIFDNSDPRNPVNLSFLAIPGNVDMAIRDGLLYADNYMDLLTIDLNDPRQPKLVDRTKDVFQYYSFIQDFGFLVAYEEKDVKYQLPCDDDRAIQPWFYLEDVIMVQAGGTAIQDFSNSVGGNVKGASGAGIGGSMARFTIYDRYLYTLEQSELEIFDLQNQGHPNHIRTAPLESWGMETIFPYKNYLFLGANNGMYIYDNSDPERPVYLSKYDHVVSCDPVFVENDIAFVTLNGNGACNAFSNQLDVIDIADVTNPKLLKTYPLVDPKGLAVRDNRLYVCDGRDGLKIFSTSDLLQISSHQLGHFKGFDTYDVIALPDTEHLLVVGKDGFHQFDTTDPANLVSLSLLGFCN